MARIQERKHCWDISIAISKCFPTLPICCLWLSQKIPVCSYCSPSMCKCEQRHQNSQNERCGSIEKCVRYAYVVGSGVKCWGWVGGRYGGVGMTKLHRVYSSLKMHEWVVTQNVFRENWGVSCVKHKAPIFKHDSKTKKIWKLSPLPEPGTSVEHLVVNWRFLTRFLSCQFSTLYHR